MTDLPELLDELAQVPAPPSRLRPGDIYTKGRRRHRRSVIAMTGTAVAVAVALVAGVALAGRAGPARPAPPVGQSGQPVPYEGMVAGAAAGDAGHLYAVVADCPTGTTPPPEWYDCKRSLVRSVDAGLTWQLRTRDIGAFDAFDLTALTADVLMVRAQKLITPGTLTETGVYVSVDGGQTWKGIEPQDTPVPAVAADGWLEWAYTQEGGLSAGDPRLARSAPLTDPPALKFTGTALRTATGSLWIDGTDPGSSRPAVAISADDGRHWSTHVFTDIPDPGSASSYSVGTATIDGRTGYVVSASGYGIDGGGRVWVHRTTDGGQTWQRVDPGGTAPWSYGGGPSYVTPDGAHVIVDMGRDNKQSFWISRDGGARYTPVTLAGLPQDRLGLILGLPRPVRGGGYVAYSDEAVYLSTDGLQWRRVVPRVA